MKSLGKYLNSGKKIPFLYYLGYIASYLTPPFIYKWRARHILNSWQSRPDAEYIRRRVDTYCQLNSKFSLPEEDSIPISKIRPGNFRSRYAIDAAKVLRYFPRHLRGRIHDADTWENPDTPTFMKARRLDKPNGENAVILNLDSIRHFQNPKDLIPFEKKKAQLFFRGDIYNKPARIEFFKKWADHPLFNLGDTNTSHPSPWQKPFCSMQDHFQYQFILALEGFDVASSLQWIMASNCIPVMTRPSAESWLMHSRMIPGKHYIEIVADFSDVGEKIEYYASHPAEAAEISRNSTEWARQFMDCDRERLISLLVAQRYFKLSGQL